MYIKMKRSEVMEMVSHCSDINSMCLTCEWKMICDMVRRFNYPKYFTEEDYQRCMKGVKGSKEVNQMMLALAKRERDKALNRQMLSFEDLEKLAKKMIEGE